MNYYNLLEISPNATRAEIKLAYKQMAMIHHPDRGGDVNTFHEISIAYNTLSDSNERKLYDKQLLFDITELLDSEIIFNDKLPLNHNRDLTIKLSISLAQSYQGAQIAADYSLLEGNLQTVILDIPPGVCDNQIIKYPGLGDDSIEDLPRGALNVKVQVLDDPDYTRVNNDLYHTLNISILDAMIGCTRTVRCLDGAKLDITINPGFSDGTEYVFKNKGFKDKRNRGAFIILVNVDIPKITNDRLINHMTKIYNILKKD